MLCRLSDVVDIIVAPKYLKESKRRKDLKY